MRTRTCKSRLKPVALLGAAALGLSAFGDYVWNATESGSWSDAANWTGEDGNYVFNYSTPATTVNFSEMTEIDGAGIWVENADNVMTFAASSLESGLVVTGGDMHIGGANRGKLKITGGSYTFPNLYLAYSQLWWENPDPTGEGELTIAGGSVTVGGNVVVGNIAGSVGTLTLDGGTISASSIAPGQGTGTLAIGAKGGTFANKDSATIATALTGSGTLTKTGAGDLTISGAITGFTGKIAVAAGAGSVTVAALNVTIAAGEEFQFGVYTWTGAAEDGLWSTPGNWLVNNAVPTAPPAADSTVVIPEGDGTELTVKCGTADYSGKLTINRNLRIGRVGNGYTENEGLHITSVEGTGTLILPGGTRGTPYWRDFVCVWGAGSPNTISCDLAVYGWVALHDQTPIVLEGALKGTGNIRCGVGISGNYTEYPNSVNPGNGQYGFQFKGDVSQFTGTYVGGLRNHGNRDKTQFLVEFEGQNASWTFGWDDSANERSPFRAGDGKTYKFGQLNTIIPYSSERTSFCYALNMLRQHTSKGDTYNKNCVIEVGAKARTTSTVGGSLGDDSNTIRKVGDTSTLDLTLTESKGGVELQAGYVNLYGQNAPATFTFSGKTAQVYVENTVGTYETTTEKVSSGEVDDPETDEDESVTTQEVTTQTSVWAPTAYGAYQLESVDVTDDNEVVTGKKYYYVTVANDAAGTSYYSVEEAFAGVTAKVAENPDFDTTVYMTRSTTEAVVIPVVGYSLSLGDYTVASVIGGAGVTTTYNEETKIWETSENAETWIGENGGLWSEPSNWSGKYTPNDRTIVTFDSDAVVYTGTTGWGGEAAAVIVNGNVTLQSDATMSKYSNIACYGDITGEGTLTLNRFGIDAGGKAISIDCDVVIENDTAAYATAGHDSWFTTGSFTVNGTTTVNGLLKTYAATVFVGDVEINDGGTVSSIGGTAPTFNNVTMTGKSGINTNAVTYNGALTMGDEAIVSIGSTTQNYGEGFVLNGSGTIVANTQLPGGTLQSNLRGNGGEGNVWTGTCEIKDYTFRECQPANFANNNSTLAFNNVQVGYFRDASYAMGIKICSGGLRLDNQYTYTRTFSGKLSGDGTITTQNNCSMTLLFTGDVSEFAGGINLNSDNATAVVFGNAATGSGERIVVNEGKSVTLASDKTWSTANVIVNGELTVAGTLDVPDARIWGDKGTGKIKFTDSTKALTIEKFASSWNGTYVVGWNPDSSSTHFVVDNYGRANSKVEIAGVNGAFIALPSTGNAAPTIATEVVLTANWVINNGWTDATTTFTKLSGSGNLTVNGASSGGTKIPYAITTLNEYTGTLGGTRSQFTIGNIVKEGAQVGDLLVKAAAEATFIDLDATTVNGETANVEFKTIDGIPGLYWVEKSDEAITVEGAEVSFAADGTITATFTEAVASADDVVVKVSGSDKSFGNGYGFKVTLAEGGMSATIAPAVTFAEATTQGTAAWTEGATDVTLNVDVVPGMYYAAASGSSLTIARPAATTPATAETVITAPKQTGEQGFYKVWVSVMPISAETTASSQE